MNTFSLFPDLLTFGLIAPLLLRISVGLILIYKGSLRYKKEYKFTSIFYVVAGVLLVLGLYTQGAAIAGFFIFGFDDYADKKIAPLQPDRIILHSLCAVVMIALLFTGAGFFAFDLPL